MNTWATICKILGYILLTLGVLLVLAGIIGVWVEEGFSGVQDLLSPFNVLNYLIAAITLAPGIGLLMLAEKMSKKAPNQDV